MARKRRRKKKTNDDAQYVEDVVVVEKGTRFIDSDLIALCRRLGIRIQKSLFAPGGFRCVRCGFSTKKKGTPGRNTMRSHHKRHLNEQRAGRSTDKLAMLFAVLLLGTIILGLVWSPLGSITGDVLGYIPPLMPVVVVYAALSVLASSVVVGSSHLYRKSYELKWRRANQIAVGSTLILVLIPMLFVLGLFGAQIHPLWFSIGIVPALSIMATARSNGLAWLRRKRHDLPPANYIPLFKAITEEGDDEVWHAEFKIKKMLRTIELSRDMLSHREKLALVSSGILKGEVRRTEV